MAAAGAGLVLVTLSITYLVPLASAVTQRHRLAGYIASISSPGATPESLLAQAWTGQGFPFLDQHLVALTPLIHLAGQRHLTYPMLHYFHSPQRRTAAAPNLAVFDEALTLLGHAMRPQAQLAPAAVAPAAEAVGAFLDTLAGALIHPAGNPLPAPDLAILRRAGISVVDDDVFASELHRLYQRRCLLAGLVNHNGWDYVAAE